MKRCFLLVVLCLGYFGSQAQEVYNSSGKTGKAKYRENAKKSGFDVNRLILGGGFGAGYGSGMFSLQVSPIAGYRLTDRLAAGVGLSFQYFSIKNGTEIFNTSTNQYEYHTPRGIVISPNIWGRYFLFDRLFASVIGEYNFSNTTDYAPALIYGNGVEKVKFNFGIPSALLGLGYAQQITSKASFVFIISYDVLQSATSRTVSTSQGIEFLVHSPYYRRLDIRFGLNLGF